ncbi:MAG: pyridoxal phosphate-dependent aminotransferase [archaeon]
MLSTKLSQIEPSATLAITAKAKQMKKEGKDVVAFGAGEPDFDTPDNIKQAAIKAINDGFTKYTPASGINELKDAIVEKFRKDNGIEYRRENVMVSCGAKHILYNATLATVNEGDEVILPSPYWVTFIEQIRLAGGKPVVVDTGSGFKFTAAMFKKHVTGRTKLLIFNSPNNPTGAIVDRDELEKIAKIAVENKIYVISDECYEKLIYDGNEHVSIASLNNSIRELTITVNAVSKAYSMTGWRIGYCAGPVDLIKGMGGLQDHCTSNPTSIAQMAALEALTGPQDSVGVMAKAFDERRKYMVMRLNRMKGITCNTPEGAFYAFPDVSATGLSSAEFCARLLEQELVAAVPGAAFGDDKCIRLSYATSMKEIGRGMDRMEKFAANL